MSDASPRPPAQPEKLQATYDVSPDRLLIAKRPRGFGGTLFLSIWLAGWTIACIALVRQAIADPRLFTLLFAAPFLAAWVVVAGALAHYYFGREELSFDAAAVRHRQRSPIAAANRSVPIDEVRDVVVTSKLIDNETGKREYGLRIRTSGRPLEVLFGLHQDELRWLAWRVCEWLGKEPAVDDEPLRPAASRTALAEETLAPSVEPVAAPSDCAWDKHTDLDALQFVNRGSFNWRAVAVMLLVNLFWNAIVGVFLISALEELQQGREGTRGLLLFLIPFELVGLVLVVLLAFTLVEPFRVTCWRFTRDAIERRRSWFGCGLSRAKTVEALARIELSTDGRAESHDYHTLSAVPWDWTGENFRLAFIGPSGRRVCRMKRLTEGEARWIADSVFRANRHWFVSQTRDLRPEA